MSTVFAERAKLAAKGRMAGGEDEGKDVGTDQFPDRDNPQAPR